MNETLPPVMRQVSLLFIGWLFAGCSCPETKSPGVDSKPGLVRLISVRSEKLGDQPVVLLLPQNYDATRRSPYPLLIAFSGRGEAVKEPERGAWGWARDYQLSRQIAALRRGKLHADDFHGLVSTNWLRRYNNSLAAAPFEDMVIACPHTFDLLGLGRLRHADYERFYLRELPEALRQRFNLRKGPRGLGLDGVSLGGLWSLMLGFAHPERVGQIGALQPAVTPFIDGLVALAKKNRGGLARKPLSLVTSTGDGLRPAVTRLSARIWQARIRHTLTVLTGPHDYVFNRGPGGLHMLLWHDRRFMGHVPP